MPYAPYIYSYGNFIGGIQKDHFTQKAKRLRVYDFRGSGIRPLSSTSIGLLVAGQHSNIPFNNFLRLITPNVFNRNWGAIVPIFQITLMEIPQPQHNTVCSKLALVNAT